MNNLYVPNNVDINNVSCVFFNSDDSVLLTINNNNYELRYNNLLNDYVLNPVGSIDVSCSNVNLTHDIYYRKDIGIIIIVFFILAIFCFYFPYRVFTRAFGRWLKL